MKKFFKCFFLAGAWFTFLGAPVSCALYLFSPEHYNIILSGFIGGLIGCSFVNGTLAVILDYC